MMFQFMNRIVMGAVIAVSLAGCAAHDRLSQVNRQNTSASDESSQVFQAMKHRPASPVEISDGYWILGARAPVTPEPHPALRETITINLAEGFDVARVMGRVTQVTGIPVRVSIDPPQGVSSASKEGASVVDSTGSSIPVSLPPPPSFSMPGMPGIPDQPLQATAAAGANAQPSTTFSFSGPLHELLNIVASRGDYAWEYRDGEIWFARYSTRVFTVHLAQGKVTLGSAQESESQGSTQSGEANGQLTGASSEVELTVERDPWADLEDALKPMLSREGVLSVSQSARTVTVTDKRHTLSRIEDYIRRFNLSATRQVDINVRVLSVALNDADQYGLQWDVITQNATRSLTLTSVNNLMSPGNTLTGAILEDADSKYAGSSAVVDALSQSLNVTEVSSARLRLINNEVGPVRITNDQSYLKQVDTTVAGDSGTVTQTLVPGQLTTGFIMHVVPHILEDDRLVMQYAIEISSLLGFETLSSGDQQIQAPNIERRSFGPQRTLLRSGQVLALSGFERDRASGDMSGMGSPKAWWLGGSNRAERNQTRLVVLIEPVLTGG